MERNWLLLEGVGFTDPTSDKKGTGVEKIGENDVLTSCYHNSRGPTKLVLCTAAVLSSLHVR